VCVCVGGGVKKDPKVAIPQNHSSLNLHLERKGLGDEVGGRSLR